MNTDQPRPACEGDPATFESQHPADHKRAKEKCDTCPVKAACQRLLEDTIRDYGYNAQLGPRGTWAGKLYADSPMRKAAAA